LKKTCLRADRSSTLSIDLFASAPLQYGTLFSLSCIELQEVLKSLMAGKYKAKGFQHLPLTWVFTL
jgi:hypothetical protein